MSKNHRVEVIIPFAIHHDVRMDFQAFLEEATPEVDWIVIPTQGIELPAVSTQEVLNEIYQANPEDQQGILCSRFEAYQTTVDRAYRNAFRKHG